MRILCISDQIDPLIYTNSIKERFSDVDMVLSAGDLPLDYLDFIVSSLNIPAFFVFGNHQLKDYAKYRGKPDPYTDNYTENEKLFPYIGAVHLGTKVKYEEGLIIAGLGGCMRYSKDENQYTEFQMKLEMIKIIPALIFNRIFRRRYLDILLTHASPRGIHDKPDLCHLGFNCFLWFMKVFKPRYLIHGHIHLYDLSELRTTKYMDTLVINAYSHFILNTDEKI
jgi:Icc-related predicted phosphoesterase